MNDPLRTRRYPRRPIIDPDDAIAIELERYPTLNEPQIDAIRAAGGDPGTFDVINQPEQTLWHEGIIDGRRRVITDKAVIL